MSKANEALQFTVFDKFFPRRPSKSDNRKIQIVEQVISEIATHGLDSITHVSIAEACKVSRPLIHHYFPDREDLILIAMQYLRARFQKLCIDEMNKHSKPKEQLTAYIETVCKWAELAPKDSKAWLLFYYYAGTKAEYKKLNTELVLLGQERIAAMLELGARSGEFKAGHYLKRAKLIQNIITGVFVSSITETHDKKTLGQMRSDTLKICLNI